MPKITSVADLKKVKDSALQKIAARLQGENIDKLTQIHVGMEDSGVAAGAKEIFNELWNLALNKDIVVMQTAKLGDFKEPAVKIILPGEASAVVFEGVTKDKAREIISEFVEKGNSLDGMIRTERE